MPQQAALVTALISDRPLCVACITQHTSMSTEAVQAALTVMERALQVLRASTTCRRCGLPGPVYVSARSEAFGGAR